MSKGRQGDSNHARFRAISEQARGFDCEFVDSNLVFGRLRSKTLHPQHTRLYPEWHPPWTPIGPITARSAGHDHHAAYLGRGPSIRYCRKVAESDGERISATLVSANSKACMPAQTRHVDTDLSLKAEGTVGWHSMTFSGSPRQVRWTIASSKSITASGNSQEHCIEGATVGKWFM